MLLICVLAHALMSSSAQAIDSHPVNATELAKQRFQEAAQAYQEGRYSAAASLFEAADRLAPHASTRYNAATAWEQAGEEARAATGYEAVLALDSLDDSRRATARERLQGLAQRLGKIRIREPLGALVTVDHVQRAPVPLTFYLRPGSYELDVAYRGTNSQTSASVLAGEEKELQLNLPLAALPVEQTPSVPLTPVPPAPRPAEDGTLQRTWGWASLGAGVALSGAAIFLGVRALNARDRFVASGNTDAEARQDAADLRLASNILWGGATVAGATGLVLLLTAPTVEF
jgi:tetratricopeptide (TPR) repeat protein